MKRNFTREELSKMAPIKPVSQLAIDVSKINRPLSEQVLTPVKNVFPIKQAITTKPIITSIESGVLKKPSIELIINRTETHEESTVSDYTELFRERKEVELTQEQDIEPENLEIENQRLKSILEEKDLLLNDQRLLITRLLEKNQLLTDSLSKPALSSNIVNESIELDEEKDKESVRDLNNDLVINNPTVNTIDSDFVCYDTEGIITAVTRGSTLIGEPQENGSIE